MIKHKAPELILLQFLIPLVSFGQTAITPSTLEIGIEEHLDELLPLDIMLVGETGEKVSLEDLIDKPTIINLVYYRCPGICSPLMEGLADVMNKVTLEAGKDYQVLTISFDPRESIELALRKKNNYLNLMSQPEAARTHWKFFVSDSLSIARLTDAVGFRYKRTGNDFLHAATIIIVSPDGKITRYIKHTVPIVEEDGSVPFLVEMSTDITETAQIRKEYRILFDQVPCNILIIDRDFQIVICAYFLFLSLLKRA